MRASRFSRGRKGRGVIGTVILILALQILIIKLGE